MKPRAITLAVTLLACARTAPQHNDGPQLAQGSETVRPPAANMRSNCPLAPAGTSVSFAPISGGGSMLFAVPEEVAVQDVRRRVRELAANHNRAANGLAMIELPHRAEMVPIPGGARLDLVTTVGNDTFELQRSIESKVRWMLEGHCR